ncbi:MAG: FAD-dependent oxidoreductase [Elusimicrobia bacterium]|nr:FAD-dependent oxidoreductase [Elusimicrobiota bacterium]
MSLLKAAVPGPEHHQELISCQAACPVRTDARGYVRAIAEGRFEEAYLIARGPNPFASICGRVCGAPCETACRRGRIPRTDPDGHYVADHLPIAIRALKRFAAETSGWEKAGAAELLERYRRGAPSVCGEADEMAALLRGGLDGSIEKARGERVAIIGSGPAGLSAAHDLALLGLSPIVFEMEAVPAGMLAFGVPRYRLPMEVIEREVAVIRALGVEIRCGVAVGRDVSLAELRRTHRAVLIAVGAKRPRLLGLPGEQGPRVLGGVDFLRGALLGETVDLGAQVIVIGGGNVAYDVARTVLRQASYDAARMAKRMPGGRSVQLVSLETLAEMPADTAEIREGDEEGVERLGGWGPLAVKRGADGRVEGLEVQRCLRVYDENRRFAPRFDTADSKTLPCDTLIIAAGQTPDLSFLNDGGEDVELMRPGWPKVDPETLKTTAGGVFVAGDLAHGTRLIIDAVASGKRAARAIYTFVTGRSLREDAATAFMDLTPYRRELGYESIRRVAIPQTDPSERIKDPGIEVERRFGRDEARREASRCLDCGVTPVFDGTRCVLCGGCVDVCPTLCLKLVLLGGLEQSEDLRKAAAGCLGPDADQAGDSVILKDEDRCIRCALCEARCPVDAISMERVTFRTRWRGG